MLSGKKILLGITGSIAAYKSMSLVRLLIKAGAEVRIVITPSAKDFVSPLTLSTLSKNPVLSELFSESSWSNHVALGRWADIFLIAPLSCNTLAKMATGLCDNMLLATYLSATCPVMIAPAMDEDMWHHPSTKSNLEKLQEWGCKTLPAEHGELASGLIGEGRMAEPETIMGALELFFAQQTDFTGKKVLITAGPTYEAIDPVRFIGNHSSGKMGYALATVFSGRGADVTLVSGPVALQPPPGVRVHKVQSAAQMFEACMARNDYDVAIMAAAVADYAPEVVANEKIKKSDVVFSLTLRKTPDILASLGAAKKGGQLLIGFALETTNEEENALKKLRSKNADAIVLNSLKDEGAGFGRATNKITIYTAAGNKQVFETKTKEAVAADIADAIHKMIL